MIDPFTWTALFAVGIVMAGLGYEYRRRPVFDAPQHWTNEAAYAVMATGRAIVYAAIFIAVAVRVSEIVAGFPN